MQFEESDTRRRTTIGWRRRFLSPLGRAKPGIPRNPAQADAIRYPRSQLN